MLDHNGNQRASKRGMKTGRLGEMGKCVSGVLVCDPGRVKKMNERLRENECQNVEI